MKMRFIMPLILFIGIVILLWRGLSLNPNLVPSPLLNKLIPNFHLPELFNPKKTVSNIDFYGHVVLLNVWASWCYACRDEHAFLLQLSQKEPVILYGLNYKDDPIVAKKWLNQYGNPYQLVAVDSKGSVAIDWGVYGTPETFLIDKKGMIRYKQVGPMTQEIWDKNVKPRIQALLSERS